MKRVLIDNLKGGEILAQEVWDDQGVQWLARGTTYKNTYLHKLSSLGIDFVNIREDEAYSESSTRKEFEPDELRVECKELIQRQLTRFEQSGSISAYKFEKVVFTIMNEIMKSVNVIENICHIKNYNTYTYEHSVNVTVIAIMISTQMDFPKQQIHDIAMGCILHDLGKTQIKEEILNKPTILTKEEFAEMKEHPINGYNIVKDNKHIKNNIKEIILTHHEKLDGSGYPLKISGNQISTGSRICAVADIFDAMCSERPYKKAIPFAEGVRTMRVSMSKQIDMEICGVLESVLK